MTGSRFRRISQEKFTASLCPQEVMADHTCPKQVLLKCKLKKTSVSGMIVLVTNTKTPDREYRTMVEHASRFSQMITVFNRHGFHRLGMFIELV